MMRWVFIVVTILGSVAFAQYQAQCPSDPPPDSPCAGGPPPGGAPPPSDGPSTPGGPGGPSGPPPGENAGGGRFGGGGPNKGSELSGDPVVISNDTAYHRVADFSVSAGKGSVRFERIFHGSNGGNQILAGIPTPFGHMPNYDYGMAWWHPWLSFVRVSSTTVEVYDSNLVLWKFYPDPLCTGPGCWLKFSSGGTTKYSFPGRLQRTQNGYRYVRPGRDEQVFEAKFIKSIGGSPDAWTHYFLSKVRTRDGVDSVTLNYATPSLTPACPLPAYAGSHPGVPYLASADLAGGYQLQFGYRHIFEDTGSVNIDTCVIDTVTLAAPGGGSTLMASYSYAGNLGGFIGSASGPQGSQAYDYGTGFAVSTLGGHQISSNTYTHATNSTGTTVGTGRVSFQAGSGLAPDLNYSISTTPSSTAGLGCATGTCCPSGSTPRVLTVSSSSLQDGSSNTGNTATMTAEIQSRWPGGIEHRPYINARSDSCTPAESCSAGSTEVVMEANPASDTTCEYPSILATKNKTGAWTLTPSAVLSGTNHPSNVSPPYVARAETGLGGNSSLTSPLVSESYSYVLSADGQRKLARTSVASAYGTNTASTHYVYDSAGSSLLGTIESGYTKALTDTSPQLRYKGVFYRQARACGGGTTADSLKRPLRIEGPCWLPVPASCNTSADCGSTEICQGNLCMPTSCPTSTPFPVTEFEYYSPTETAHRASRLSRVTQYAGGSACTGGLVTEYQAYTPEGYPTEIKTSGGASGDSATLYNEYAGGYLAKQAQLVSGNWRETYFGWDEGQLAWVRHPEGNHEVFCHRVNTGNPTLWGVDDGCVGATVTPQLQWRAKADDEYGGGAAEVAFFSYYQEGSLKSIQFASRDSSGTLEVRRTITQNVDAHGRQTYLQVGTNPSYSRVTRYDGSDNVVATSPFAVAAPDFCKNAGTASFLCSWMTNDRAGRTAEIRRRSSAFASNTETKTCLDYDVPGNISRVAAGCATGAACSVNQPGVKSTCDSEPIDYEWDDFGNVIKASMGPGGAQWFRYEYNGLSLPIAKRSSANAANSFVRMEYDQLGRLVATRALPSNTLLSSVEYDGIAVSSASSFTIYNTYGRPSRLNDSFGTTWYSYDESGALTAEYRERSATPGQGWLNNPSTEYSYDLNGNLTSIRYPYGRLVEYRYGSGALRDRVESIDYEYFESSTESGMRPLVRDAKWEPFGGLRGYTIVGHDEAWYKSVEYVLSPVSDRALPSGGDSCAATGLGDIVESSGYDETARTRAVWVSAGSLDLGFGDGAILKQAYAWDRDQVSQIGTCLLNGTWTLQTMAYDNMQRLVESWGDNFQTTKAGMQSNRVYEYNAKSGRTRTTADGYPIDVSGDLGWSHEWGSLTPTLDAAGRLSSFTKGYPSWGGGLVVDFDFDDHAASSEPVDSVYRSATITRSGGSQVFEYFYDARGQRRLKVHPLSGEEESFYTQGGKILTDTASQFLFSTPLDFVADDYIWLDDRMIAFARGSVQGGSRQGDHNSASRLGEQVEGRVYFIVSDWIGKPILTLDAPDGRVTGYGLYDDFGFVNRAPMSWLAYKSDTVREYGIPEGLPNVKTRVLFQELHLDHGEVRIDNDIAMPSSAYDEYAEWTPWMPSLNSSSVELVVDIPSSSDGFAITEAFEYQVSESGDLYVFPPFRFPGQRHDPETDLHENWNRYYDPYSGRYFSPEPLFQEPEYMRSMAQNGLNVPTYDYALNNPHSYTDPDGLSADSDWSRNRDVGVRTWRDECRAGNGSSCAALAESFKRLDQASTGAACGMGVAAVGRFLVPALGYVWKNTSFDGPSPGIWRANGRIAGVRWKKSQWGARLDLHPLPGSPNPILHINYGPLSRGEAAHVRLWDPIDWWTRP